MSRLFVMTAAFVLALTFGPALAEEKKVTSIEDVMEKAHGEDGLKDKITAANKAKKLADAKEPAQEWTKLAADLGKNKPPVGEADSWKKLTTAYEKQVKALATAVKDDKGDDVTNAIKAINGSCVTCHKAHKKP